jgi:hypothetical protein
MFWKKPLLTFLILLFLIINFTRAQIHLSGALQGTLIDTTYIVDGNIYIGSWDTLVIEPGAIFLFNGEYGFNIIGYIIAVGTAEDSIVFRPYQPNIQ